MNLQAYKHDEKKAEQGTWMEFDGARFLIASSRSKRFQKFIATATRKHNQAELKKNPGIFLEITNAALAEVVLLDWQGVNDGTNVVPPTIENRRALIAMPEFRDWLSETAGDMDNFRKEAIAEDAEALKSSPTVAPGVE